MDMGTAAGALEEAGNEDFVQFKNFFANRTYPVPLSNDAIKAAPDMHEPVFAAVSWREMPRSSPAPPLEKFG